MQTTLSIIALIISTFAIGLSMGKAIEKSKRFEIEALNPIPGNMYVVDSTERGLLIVVPSKNY